LKVQLEAFVTFNTNRIHAVLLPGAKPFLTRL
jgi:hypothetical protein